MLSCWAKGARSSRGWYQTLTASGAVRGRATWETCDLESRVSWPECGVIPDLRIVFVTHTVWGGSKGEDGNQREERAFGEKVAGAGALWGSQAGSWGEEGDREPARASPTLHTLAH